MTQIVGELACRVHLAAAVEGLMEGGGAVLVVREIQRNTQAVRYFCTCCLPAEFHINNVGLDRDEPFPIFTQIKEKTDG